MQKLLVLTSMVATLAPGVAQAETAAPLRPAQRGLCVACHGDDGQARIPVAPNLAGQPYQYLLQALHEYRLGQRNLPVMRAAVAPLAEKDMQALAHWYAAQSPCKPPQAERP